MWLRKQYDNNNHNNNNGEANHTWYICDREQSISSMVDPRDLKGVGKIWLSDFFDHIFDCDALRNVDEICIVHVYS